MEQGIIVDDHDGGIPIVNEFDEVDASIMEILVESPRAPYTEIQSRLEEHGHTLSTEGIRYRVRNIIDSTSVFFLLDPSRLPSEILRVVVRTKDEQGAKAEVFEFVSKLSFWHISRGLGTYDIFAVGSFSSMSEAENVITIIEEHDSVAQVEYIIVTERNRQMDKYLVRDYIDVE